jgi:hypothetical protein
MSSQHPMMTREIVSTERGVRTYFVEVDGSLVAGGTAVTTGLVLGSLHMTITENGDGDYTLNLNVPGQRVIGVSGLPKTANSALSIGTVTLGAVQVLQTDLANAAQADADFYLQIHVSTAADAT